MLEFTNQGQSQFREMRPSDVLKESNSIDIKQKQYVNEIKSTF